MKFDTVYEKGDVMNCKVVGIGGAGRNILNALIASGFDRSCTLNIDTDINAKSASKAPFLQIGKNTCKGRGSVQTCVGFMAAKESEDDIIAELCGAEVIVLVAGLGGGCGTGAIIYISKLAVDKNAKTFAFVTTPAEFEPKHRKDSADECVTSLHEILGDNLKVISVATSMTGLRTLFDTSNKEIIRGINEYRIEAG